MASAPITSDALTVDAVSAVMSPRTRLAVPAIRPFRNTTCWGESWSMRAVTPLSKPQATQAPAMSKAPVSTVAPGGAGDGDECGADEQPATEVFAKDRGGEGDGGGELEVQQDRGAGGGGAGEAGDQERRSDGAAGDDGHRRRLPVAVDGGPVGSVGERVGGDGEPGAEVEEPGEHEDVHAVGQLGRSGGGGAEEQGGGQAAQHASSGHASQFAAARAGGSRGRWNSGSEAVIGRVDQGVAAGPADGTQLHLVHHVGDRQSMVEVVHDQ